jgi:sRNA-binding regulator protein Hfq
VEETAVVAELGKPLEELSYHEARRLNGRYMQLWKEKKKELGLRPPDTRRKRIQLPESVDEFEANYLQARLEGQEPVTFTLINEKVFTGQVIGFSPYNIAIRQPDGQEMVLNKLGLAYYAVEAA